MSRLPFLFIITGMIGFVLFHSTSLWSLYDWVGGGMRGPTGWFQTHLFVLGWATMLAMGAVYQLINVILNSKTYSERLGFIQYALFTIGLVGLLYGFYTVQTIWIGSFATLAFIGILLFSWNIGATLLRAKRWDAITISVTCAVAYLVLTGLTGMAMGLNFLFGQWDMLHERLFGAHIWLGTIGWFGLLITGFSYKLLPMFYLSHHYPTRLQSTTLVIWNAGVVTGVVAFLTGGGFWPLWSALLLIAFALIVYNYHLLQIRKHRHKPNPGLGVKWSVYASQALAGFALLMLLYTFIYPEQLLQHDSVTLAGWIYLGGWVSFTILCYASKIIPFLWWTYKYGTMVGKPGTPTMATLLDEKKVRIGLAVIAAFILLLFAGLLLDTGLLIAISGIAFSVSSVMYMILLARVFAR